MISKDSLREEFSKKPDEYYNTELFKKEGFVRKRCKICGKYFWTADPGRELCGDPSHEPYSFFREKQRSAGYVEFWRRFSKFFSDAGHAIIDSYPVVSRWRQDLYFTIAGIQDFQRIENNKMNFEYPANPLLVPQMCLRFNDIPNTGITGRHFTSFMMANQTAFNYPKEGYWRDKTIELNFKVLTQLLGIDKKDITYIEDVWAMGDFSEFGPCLESFAHGLELVNNVFTQFSYENGKIEELKGKVVDVGWGFERLLWYYTGAYTAYDPVFKNELSYLYKAMGIKPNERLYSRIAGMLGTIDLSEESSESAAESKLISSAGISREDFYNVIKPMQAAYAIADHSRTLLFAITDGALPSNVGGGYNLRVLLRRMFDFMEQYGSFDILKVMELHVKDLRDLYPRLGESLGEIGRIIETEKKRYESTKSTAMRIISGMLERKEKLTPEKLATLYESNGITPEMIERVAKSKGLSIEIPENAYLSIIKGDFAEKEKEQKVRFSTEGVQKTEKLYYKGLTECDAKVLSMQGDIVMLDRSVFYPEGGGQEADHGSIENCEVIDVQQENGVIAHIVKGKPNFKVGDIVHCAVDQERRLRLMAHHTATHLISASARSILGRHAWQEGAKKTAEKAHIDIAHYERLSKEQIQAIEDKANSFILHGIKVKVEELDRGDAESRFGFSIYQGHGVPSKRLRIVEIYDLEGNLIDAEACGGLHLEGRESSIGIIKIRNAYRIHDGIDRLEYVAGPAVQQYINEVMQSLDSMSALLGIDRDKLSESMEPKIKELELYRKKYVDMQEELSDYIASAIAKESTGNSKIVKMFDYDRRMLRKIATKCAELSNGVAILHNSNGEVVAVSRNGESAIESLKAFLKLQGKELRGGGTDRIAEGKMV
ncbi:MAG: alanine--tRNA ligase [Candidatus Micrarchaeia archaeon]